MAENENFVDLDAAVNLPKKRRKARRPVDADTAILEAPDSDSAVNVAHQDDADLEADSIPERDEVGVPQSAKHVGLAPHVDGSVFADEIDDEDAQVIRPGLDSITPDGRLQKSALGFGADETDPVRVDPSAGVMEDFDVLGPSRHDVVRDAAGVPFQDEIGAGNSGGHVFAIQGALWRAGAYRPVQPSVIDGIFASETAAAVRLFQEENDLEVTGSVNADTWKALKRFATGARK